MATPPFGRPQFCFSAESLRDFLAGLFAEHAEATKSPTRYLHAFNFFSTGPAEMTDHSTYPTFESPKVNMLPRGPGQRSV